jgi:hypothetical protein
MLSADDAWTTAKELEQALAGFESALGWRRPVLHGLASVPSAIVGEDADGEPVFGEVDGEIEFVRVNDGQDLLAAAVLATVTGWSGGSGSVRFGSDQLTQAIDLLAPSEGYAALPHANLRTWRDIRTWLGMDDGWVAVLDSDPDAACADPYVLALRQMAASGRQDVPEDEIHTWRPPAGSHPLAAAWTARWPQVAPISYHLRALEDRWVRFHTLPGSKRCADNPAEYATILNRHNTVIGELLGNDTNLLVITLAIGFSAVPQPRDVVLDQLLPDADCWSILSWPNMHPMLAFAYAYVNTLQWHRGRLDDLLTKVADDEVAHVIICPPDLAWLYAPYDGGMDVLLPTSAFRDRMSERHRSWLSTLPSGL